MIAGGLDNGECRSCLKIPENVTLAPAFFIYRTIGPFIIRKRPAVQAFVISHEDHKIHMVSLFEFFPDRLRSCIPGIQQPIFHFVSSKRIIRKSQRQPAFRLSERCLSVPPLGDSPAYEGSYEIGLYRFVEPKVQFFGRIIDKKI